MLAEVSHSCWWSLSQENQQQKADYEARLHVSGGDAGNQLIICGHVVQLHELISVVSDNDVLEVVVANVPAPGAGQLLLVSTHLRQLILQNLGILLLPVAWKYSTKRQM
jgi:hypothetical protein